MPQKSPADFGLSILRLSALAVFALLASRTARAEQPTPVLPTPVLLDAMTTELQRAFTSLGKTPGTSSENQLPPYFLSYSVSDASAVMIRAQYGALVGSSANRVRVADVQVRLGDPKLDNTHGDHRGSAVNSLQLPLVDDREALARSLWLATNTGYGNCPRQLPSRQDRSPGARERRRLLARLQQRTAAGRHRQTRSASSPSTARHGNSACARSRASSANIPTSIRTSSCSPCRTRPTTSPLPRARASSRRTCRRVLSFSPSPAPTTAWICSATRPSKPKPSTAFPRRPILNPPFARSATSLEALRKAPVTEPFDGPAILSGRASAVFFHEVLGHRLEGQRQRGDEEGQTFTKDIGKDVLPSFLSVADDPTRTTFGQTWLSGSYTYDDEGQKAQRVELIQDGVLKTFLMSRLPIASFSESNGHGRAQTGRMPTGRQGNLIVTSTKTVPDAELRKQLIEEAKEARQALRPLL